MPIRPHPFTYQIKSSSSASVSVCTAEYSSALPAVLLFRGPEKSPAASAMMIATTHADLTFFAVAQPSGGRGLKGGLNIVLAPFNPCALGVAESGNRFCECPHIWKDFHERSGFA